MSTTPEKLLALAKSPGALQNARVVAKIAHPRFPDDGCAAMQSALLQAAGVGNPMILGAEELADWLRERNGWKRVEIGHQRPGDIGVTKDLNGNGRADHIYLVVFGTGPKDIRNLIVDNQSTVPHKRAVDGSDGKTPTEYYLRSPDAEKPRPPRTVIVRGKILASNEFEVKANGDTWIKASVFAPDWDEVTNTVVVK